MEDVSQWDQHLSRKVVTDFNFQGWVRVIFELVNLPSYKPGAAASGSSPAGAFTGEAGFMAYYEICDKITNNGWTEVYDSTNMKSAYAYGDGVWCGFENQDSLSQRCNIINKRNYAGVMFWDTALDDFTGTFCGQGEYPLISLFKDCLE